MSRSSHLPDGAPPPGLAREEGVLLFGLLGLFAVTSAWWALALWPVHDAPGWLERTRYVCFGVAESGLPDAGGWIGLVAGPLGMLVILLVGWWRGLRSLLARVRTSRALAATFAGLALGSVLLVSGAALRVRDARAAMLVPETAAPLPPASYPRRHDPAPSLALVGHDGVERSITQLRGRPVLVTFAFAHCQTVCPLVVRDALAAQEILRNEGSPTAVLIVTLDPWRDTPSRLPSMAKAWQLPGQDAWVLGGAVGVVERALDAWQVPRRRDSQTGGVTHPSLVYVVDLEGRIAFAAAGGAETLAALVRRL